MTWDSLFIFPREHVVIHPHDHGNENNRVVEEMKLDARNPELHEARRHRAAEEVGAENHLHLQQQVFEMVEELNAALTA